MNLRQRSIRCIGTAMMLAIIAVSALPLGAAAIAGADSAAAPAPAAAEMVLIPGGVYRPLYRSEADVKEVAIEPFWMDVRAVTNGEFLEFVQANPRWQRSRVSRLMADERYLQHWAGDLDSGDAASRAMPVTHVSWFAAKAYASWRGKRLPTIAEWELAAAASWDRADGESDTRFRAHVLAIYMNPPAMGPAGVGQANYHGVRDLHGAIWEHVADFSTIMISGDGRSGGELDRRLMCGSGAQGARDPADYPAFVRFAMRSSLKANYCIHNVGFRCVRTP